MNDQKQLTTKTPRHEEQRRIGFNESSLLLSLVSWCLGGAILFLAGSGCSKGNANIPDITDEPLTAVVEVEDMPETVPAYGIVTGGALEVNVEKEDAPQVLPGQRATALVGISQIPLECRVTSILPNANLATGMAIAWLRPAMKTTLPEGDFVSAQIILRVKHRVVTVPQQAVLIRDGKTMAIRLMPNITTDKTGKVIKADDGLPQYEPVEVKTGIASDKDVEILSGLKPGDQVVVKAGIGYLYPEFQSETGD